MHIQKIWYIPVYKEAECHCSRVNKSILVVHLFRGIVNLDRKVMVDKD